MACWVSERGFNEWVPLVLTRCEDKAVKKLLSHFGGSRSEESRSAVVELLEKVTSLNKQLELKESQACKAELDMDQVQNTDDHHHYCTS